MLTSAVKRELRSRLELLIPTLIDDDPSPIIELIFSFFALAPMEGDQQPNQNQVDAFVDYQIRDKLSRYFNDQTQTFAQEMFGILHDIRSNQPIPDMSNKQSNNQPNHQTNNHVISLTDDSNDDFDIYGDAPTTLKRRHDEIEDEPTVTESPHASTSQPSYQSSDDHSAVDHSVDLDGDSRRQRTSDNQSSNPPSNQSYQSNNQSFNQSNNGPVNKRQRNDAPKPCFDFQRTGQCHRGENCRWAHSRSNNQSNNQSGRQNQQGYQSNQQQGGYTSTYSNASNRSSNQSNKLLITDIPPECYKLSMLTQHFSLFGEISGIQLLGDGRSEVTYSDHQSAAAAYNHPKAVFDNRFIKVLWADQSNNQSNNHSNNQPQHRPDNQSYQRSNTDYQSHHEPAAAPPPARSALEVARAIAQSKASAQVEELSNLNPPPVAHINPSPPRSALEVAAMLKAKQANASAGSISNERPIDEQQPSTLSVNIHPPSSSQSSSDDTLRPITPSNASPSPTSAPPSALEVAKTLKMNQLKKLMSQYEEVKDKLKTIPADDDTRTSLEAQAAKLKSEIAAGLSAPSTSSPSNNQSNNQLDEALPSSSYRGRGGRGFPRGRGRGNEYYGRDRGRGGYGYE